MSDCRSCCATNVLVPNDLSYGSLIYATQDYSFVINCPPGYVAKPGLCPVTVIIDKGQIPPVQVPTTGNQMTLRSCSGFVVGIIPDGASQSAINAIAAAMQQEWARRQALCDVTSTLTPLPIPGRLSQTIGNNEQCFTTTDASCSGGRTQHEPVTYCVPENTYTQTIDAPTTAQVAAIKNSLNALALLAAQAQAESEQECGWFNAGNSYSNGCSCSPGCGIYGPFGWTWNGGEFFSTVSQADANSQAFCAACDQLFTLCVKSGCPTCSVTHDVCKMGCP